MHMHKIVELVTNASFLQLNNALLNRISSTSLKPKHSRAIFVLTLEYN